MAMRVETHVGIEDLRQVAERARQVEALGYDGLAVAELQYDPFLPLVPMALATERVTLTTSVAIAFPRSPFVAAMMSWDLQRASNGRFRLGLGTQVKGHNERRFSVPWGPAGPRLRDYVLAVRAAWRTFQTGARPDFKGEHYQFTLINPTFNPGPIEHPDIPIELAAVNAYNARLVGEVADGLRTHGFTTRRYQEAVIIPAVLEGLRRAGRPRSAVALTGGGFIATGPDWPAVERQIEGIKRRIAFYGSTRTYFPVFEAHGWSVGDELHALSVRNGWAEMPKLITDEIVEAFAVLAPYDHLVAKLRERYGGIADSIGLELPASADPDFVRSLLAQVRTIPTFQEAGAESATAEVSRAGERAHGASARE